MILEESMAEELEPQECHCGECDPGLHEDCSADCIVYDCTSPEACCNSECLKDQ